MLATVRLLLAFGAALLVVTNAEVFRFEARVPDVSHENVRHLDKRKSVLDDAHKTATFHFSKALGATFTNFQVNSVHVHGAHVDDPMAVLNGYIETSMTRDELVEKLHDKDTGITLFHLLPVDASQHVEHDAEDDEVVTAPVTRCRNGGVLLPNATCACPPFYSGDQCEVVNCLNAGILGANNKCVCPPGFHSEFCEARSCSVAVEDNYDFSQATIFFTVSTKHTMGYDLNQLIPEVKQALANVVKANPNYFANFVLTTFLKSVNGGTYMKTQSFTKVDDFVNAIMGIVISEGTATQPIFTAMNQGLRTFSAQKGRSYMYVFADSDASDYTQISNDITSTSMQNAVLMNCLLWRVHPFMILTGSTSNNWYNTQSQSFDALKWVGGSAHGDIYTVQKKDVGATAADMLPLHIKSENVYIANGILCNSILVQVPQSDGPVYFNLYNNNAVLSGTTADLKKEQLTPLHTYGNLKTYKIDPTKYISVQGSNSDQNQQCGCRMFVSTDVTMLNAFASDAGFDNGNVVMIAGLRSYHNALVLNKDVQSVSWEPVSDDDMASLGEAESFNNTQRSTCTFPWQVNSEFKCTAGPFTSKYTINGNMMRILPNHCFTSPKVTPPSLQCQNGGTVVNGKCNCTVNYKDDVCQTPICQNTGSVNPFPGNGQPVCLCPPGLAGTFCEVVACNNTSTDDIDVSYRTMAIAVRTSYSLAYIGSDFSGMVSSIVNGAHSYYNDYYQDYILTTFNANVSTILTEKYRTGDDFKNASTLSFGYSAAGEIPAMTALYQTLLAMDKPRSALYFFTDAPIKTEFGTSIEDVKKYAIERGVRINSVILPPFQDYTMCLSMNETNKYHDLSLSTGGVTFDLCREDSKMDTVFILLAAYATAYDYQMEVADMKAEDCTNPITVSYSNVLPGQEFFVIASSVTTKNGFTVTASNGTATQPAQQMSQVLSIGIFQSALTGPVTVTVSGGGDYCSVQVLEHSPLSAFLTFSTDPSTDTAFVSPQLQHALYPVVRLSTALQSRPKLVTVTALEKGTTNQIYSKATMPRRESCLYDQYANSAFACSKPNEEFFMTVQVQTDEVTIQRVVRSFCRVSADTCLNGGTYVAANSTCMCTANYRGANCEIKNCQNQATFAMGVCNCQTGFTGDLCQYAVCDSWNYMAKHNALTHNFRTIGFAVEATKANAQAFNVFLLNIAEVMQEIQMDDVNVQYALVTYDDKSVRRRIITPDIQRFQDALKSLRTSDFVTAQGNVLTADAINDLHAMTSPPAAQNPALLVVLTSSNSNAPQSLSEQQFIKPRSGTQVNIIYSNQDATFDVTKPNFDYLNKVAYQSEGRVMPLTYMGFINYDTSFLFRAMLRAHSLIADTASLDCSKGLSLSFTVESEIDELYIDVVGYTAPANMVVKDGTGKTVQKYNPIYEDTGSGMYIFSKNDSVTLGGQWTVQILKATGRCQIQARARSPIHVNLAFSTSVHDDFPQVSPPYLATNKTFVLTAQVPGLDRYAQGVMLEGVDLIRKSIYNGSTTLASSTAFIQRAPGSCSYQFATFPISFDTQKEDYQFVVGGVDANGTPFKRTIIYSYDYYSLQAENACHNGGTVDAFGFCRCSSKNYVGDECTRPVCQNGGSVVGTACLCPTSYYGKFCESMISQAVAQH